MTIVLDLPFHAAFHGLPSETRIHLTAEGVRSGARFKGDLRKNAQQHESASEASISTDWNSFVSEIGTDEEVVVLQAEIEFTHPFSTLKLGTYRYPTPEWNDVEIRSERVRFFVGDYEFSIEEFLNFGDAYWNERAAHSTSTENQPLSF